MVVKVGTALAIGAVLLASAAQAQRVSEDPAAADWPRYARDLSGTRYSSLDEIDTTNVGSLEVAWTFRLRPDGGAGLLGGTVPIVIGGIRYLPLGNAVVALEADTGTELWRHPVEGGLVRRSVSYWPGEGRIGPRIFYNTGNAITAISPRDGRGRHELRRRRHDPDRGNAIRLSPSIFGNVMLIGASTAEMPRGPSGNSRAYDARTGSKLWEFNTVPQPGEVGHETWLDDGWKERSGTNMWVWYTTADPATNTLYMTIGSPSPNYYGGDRPGANLFGNSLVAVDIRDRQVQVAFPDDPPRPVGLGPASAAGAARRDQGRASACRRWR